MSQFWKHKTCKTIEFGPRVRALRHKHDLTLVELSRLTGINNHYIGQLERGCREPTAHKVAMLARALGCTTDHLILGR
jgi:transcriptional regulator with XRE-family HTH domain